MRPTHWLKNGFVVAPILFSGRYTDPTAWQTVGASLGVFCLLSSAVYILNDLKDRELDRRHPTKRNRAIAAGRVSPGGALLLASLLLGLAAVGTYWLETVAALQGESANLFRLWAGLYLFQGVLYSVWLKHIAIVDVMTISMGFVLRAMGGAAAIAVPISPWLVLCTFTLCLYLGLTKRRAELFQLPDASTRPSIGNYDPTELDRMLTIAAGLAITTYSLYCLAPGTVRRIGSSHMIWTILPVVYGIFRYDRTSRRTGKGDIIAVLLVDRVMWLIVAAYLLLALLVIQFGHRPPLDSILLPTVQH